MKTKENFLFASLIRLTLVCLFVEFGFHFLAFGFSFDASLITIICCTLTVCPIICIIASFFPVKVGKIIISVICWLFSAYAITQLQFHNFMGSYISVKATFDGAARITEFVGQFIMTIKPIYWTLLLGALISEILVWKRKYKKADDLMVILGVIVFASYMHIMTIVSITSNGQMGLYEYPQYISKALQQFGLGRFIYLDFKSIGQEEKLTVTIPNATPSPTSTPQATSEVIVEDEPHRSIDDSAWIEMMNQEKNNDMKTIDQYLMQRTIPDYNDHTGMFKDMNVIYIMIEAFDYMALDEELTPTLVRMKKEGWDFSNHYTPKFSCATGESEFVSEISLVPQSDVCTPNQYATNHWPNSIFQMFKNNRYDTYAFHNWRDEYYERRTIYENSGCDVYLNYEDQSYHTLAGWQSDKEMMELTLPEYIHSDQFLTVYITSSTHFPYDSSSALGDRYLNEINEVHPDYPMNVKRYISKAMELDKAMEYLMEELDKVGKLDNTLFVMFADHHPLKTDLSTIADYTFELDRRIDMNEDRTPLIMYNTQMTPTKQEKVSSTYDILPTTLNLMGFEYEPRIYVGRDHFSNSDELVIFPNGDWITDEGYYRIDSDTYTSFKEEEITEDKINTINTEVQNLFNISRMIYKNNYFESRESITTPTYSN